MPESLVSMQCRELPGHTPDADVNYRPGQDIVAGKALAPADIAGTLATPQDFAIDIDVDVTPGLGGANPSGENYYANARVGWVGVRRFQGQTELDFNGDPFYRSDADGPLFECTPIE